MSDDVRKTQIAAEFDASGVRAGTEDAKDAVRDLAHEVTQSSEQAAEGIKRIGEGAELSAQQVERGTRSMLAKLREVQVQLASVGKDKAYEFELRAQVRGLDMDKLRPEIEAVRQLDKAVRQQEQAQAAAARAAQQEAEAQRQAAAAKRAAEASQQSFLRSLQDQVATLGKSSEEVLRYRAAQLGIGREAEEMITKLERARIAQQAQSSSMGQMGVSAAQTTAALRQVPAQLTDIVTALQGGQAPMTVLLQQGGQLKDAFGGIGPAARAMGGYVLGLVNPFTMAAAAGAALFYGWAKGSQEGVEFNRTLILSGNAAGYTANGLAAAAARVDSFGTTQAKAAESLLVFVDAGVRATEGLERYTSAAIKLEQVGGGAVEKSAKAFADLGREPLQAAIKLNETVNFLTVSTYQQIKAAEDQGRSTDAARIAQEAYAAAIEERTPKVLERLGAIERKWLAIKGGAAEARDALLSVGREPTPQERRDGAQKAINQATSEIGDARRGAVFGNTQDVQRYIAAREQVIAQNRVLIQDIDERLRREGQVAGMQRLQAAQVQLQIEADGELLRLGIGKLSLAERELALRNKLQAAGKSPEQINAAVEVLRQQDEATKAAIKLQEEEAAQLERLSGLSGSYYKDLDALFKLYDKGRISVERYRQAVADLTNEQPFTKKETDEEALKRAEREILQEQAKLRSAERRAEEVAIQTDLNQREQAQQQVLAGLRQRIDAVTQENEALDLARTKQISLAAAIAQVTMKRLEDRRAFLQPGSGPAKDIDDQLNLQRQLADQQAVNDLNKFLDPTKAQDFGTALTKAFDGAGNSLAKMVNLLGQANRTQTVFAQQYKNLDAVKDPAERMRKQLELNRLAERESIDMYAGMAGAAKGFFEEGSRGYKTLEAAETAFRVYQLGSDLAKGLSAAAVGIANQAQGDPYTAVPRMAAMAAIMAGLGFAVGGIGGGGGSTGGDGAKIATGKGTVFGDADAKSESIGKSIDRLRDTAQIQLRVQTGMLDALQGIEAQISGVTNQVLRSGFPGDASKRFGIPTGTFTPGSVKNFGGSNGGLFEVRDAFTKVLANIPVFDKITQALFGQTIKITGTGLSAGPQELGSVLQGGLNLQNYADVNNSKKFFGIKVSSKDSTQYQAADPALARQFGLIFTGFADALKIAAGPLDQALGGVTERVNGFVVDIGKIDLQGLKGDEIQEKLSAVLGAEADRLAAAALPGLEAFQNVGEGYFETTVRVAAGIETAEAALDTLGIGAIRFTDITRKQGDVGAEIVRQSLIAFETVGGATSSVAELIRSLNGEAQDLTETYTALTSVRDVLRSVGEDGNILTASLIRGAGGLDRLASATDFYFENFFTEGERAQAQTARMAEQFARLGQPLPEGVAGFRALVQGIDTSTESGQKFLGQVLALGEGFLKVTEQAQSLQQRLDDAVAEALPKFLRKSQLDVLEYARIAADLGKAGVPIAVESLMNAGKEEIFDFARTFYEVTTNSTEAKIAVVQAASALADLKGAAVDFVQVGDQRIQKGQFSAKVESITDAQIRAAYGIPAGLVSGSAPGMSPSSLSGLTQNQLNFAVGSSTWMAAAANSLAYEAFIQTKNAADAREQRSSYGTGGGASGETETQRAQRENTEALRRLSDSLGNWIESLTQGDLSPLSPEAKFEQAQSSFYSVLAQARNNDAAAREQLQQRAQEYLQANNDYFGKGTAAGTQIFNEVVAELQRLRAQVGLLTEVSEANNDIAADGFSAVERATQGGSAAAERTYSALRLNAQRTVGFEA